MNTQFTITIAGQDYPQLVNQLAATTNKLGGKWLVSKISRLDQQLVGIIKIEIPAASADQLKQEFNALKELHVRIVENTKPIPPSKREQVTLKVESNDRLGIVNDITHTLDNIGIDITQIENHRVALADLGRTVFFAELSLDMPSEISIEQLVEAVQQVEENMRVEVIS
ncbi:glycine cleavage system protein R [Photobacterium lipolyticum]|uniref:Glycine cleavage system transcriptional repressor n=1 Tax=Photobacterium lipolyticum TaxID=266810 RepID=A0A2T3N2L6_9GAMM|nr:ACT domain-containing protein [Photobacterium lipolyticum]PSW06606.1 transcriptional regulator [Photobacterium lipolyticum]